MEVNLTTLREHQPLYFRRNIYHKTIFLPTYKPIVHCGSPLLVCAVCHSNVSARPTHASRVVNQLAVWHRFLYLIANSPAHPYVHPYNFEPWDHKGCFALKGKEGRIFWHFHIRLRCLLGLAVKGFTSWQYIHVTRRGLQEAYCEIGYLSSRFQP
jgi:hypothetical protein